jgi:hypothetical protein
MRLVMTYWQQGRSLARWPDFAGDTNTVVFGGRCLMGLDRLALRSGP